MYHLQYADRVVSVEIPKLDHADSAMIVHAIESKLMVAPEAFGKPLRYTLRHLRVLRVGNWRVIYQLMDNIVHVVAIRHRKQGYNDLL